jgi:hypothetical protein
VLDLVKTPNEVTLDVRGLAAANSREGEAGLVSLARTVVAHLGVSSASGRGQAWRLTASTLPSPMDHHVTDAELRSTIDRMEQRLAQVLDPFVAELFDAYRELKPQFFADLADEREALLSCGGALMLAQAWGRRRGVLDAEGRGPGAPSSAP